jgi:hypothetical protein
MNIAGALMLIAASAAAFAQSDSSIFSLATDPPFRLTIDCRLSMHPEDPLERVVVSSEGSTVCVKKTNISDHEITETPRMRVPSAFKLDVRDSDGIKVGLRHSDRVDGDGRGVIVLGSPATLLQPNESRMEVIPLANLFDIRKPGDYTIQVWAHVSDDPKSDIVKSNIITVTVLPPPPQAEEPK